MPRRNQKARKQKVAKSIRRFARLCWNIDDGLRPGRIVAAAKWVGCES